jgi:multiple sugar transport system permease protein
MKIIDKTSVSNRPSVLSVKLWNFTGTALLNLFIFILLFVYLSPLFYMLVTSLKTNLQLLDGNSPIWPALAETYSMGGKAYTVYEVPTEKGTRQLALIEPGRKSSVFIDPVNPQEGKINWTGSWRTLRKSYRFNASLDNFVQLCKYIDYPRSVKNSLTLVLISGLGMLASSIAVAYGLSRFRIPGGKYLFYLLVATIMIPESILIVPDFVIFNRILGWNGSFLPMIVPNLFGSAVYIFLLRQNFKSIPIDLDEAAMLDGAGPLRILWNIILPQSIPVVTTVALLHFFNMWNEVRLSSLYLGMRQDLQTLALTSQISQSLGSTSEGLQASALLLLVVPVLVLFISQRFFMQGMSFTRMEK